MKSVLLLLIALISMPAFAQGLDACTNYRLPIASADPAMDSWVKQYLKIFSANSNEFERAVEASDFCASQISSRLFNPALSSKYVETLQLLSQGDPTGENGLGVLALRLQKDWDARYLWTYNAKQQNEMGVYRTRTGLVALLGLAFQPVKASKMLLSHSVSSFAISRALFATASEASYELAGKRVGIDRGKLRLLDNRSLYTPPAPALYIEFSDPAAADLFAIDGQWQEEFRDRYRVYNDIGVGFAINTVQGLKLFENIWTRLGIAESSALARSGTGGARMAKVGRGGALVGIFLGLDFLVNGVIMDAYERVPVSDKLNELQLKRNEYEIAAQKMRATADGSADRTEAARQVYRLANQFAHTAIGLSQLMSRPYLKAYINWMETDAIVRDLGPKLAKPTEEDIANYRAETGYTGSNDFYIAREIMAKRTSALPKSDVEALQKVMASYGRGSADEIGLLGMGIDPKDTQYVIDASLKNLTDELRSAAVDGGSASGSTIVGWLAGWLSSWFKTPTTFADPSFTPYLWFQFLQPPRFKSLNDANLSGFESTFLGLTPFDQADRQKMDDLIQKAVDAPEDGGKISPRFAANVRKMMDLATKQLQERAARDKLDLATLSHDQKLDLWRRAIFEYRGNLDRMLALWLQRNDIQAIDNRPRPDHILLLAAATLRNVLREADLVNTPLYQEIEYMAQTTLTTKAGEYHLLLSQLFGEVPEKAQDAIEGRLWNTLEYNSAWFKLYDPRGEAPPMDSYMYVSF